MKGKDGMDERGISTDEAAPSQQMEPITEPLRDKGTRCRNCGNPVPKLFCTYCGQSVKEIRVSFYSLIMDFLGDYFTFDSKFLRSIKPLFFKPGFLTKAFMDGKRVAYIPPLRLYIFSSIIFFLTLSLVTNPEAITESPDPDPDPPVQTGEPTDASSKIVALGMPKRESLAQDPAMTVSEGEKTPTGSELEESENEETSTKPAEATQDEKNRSKKSTNVQITSGRFSENTKLGHYFNERIDRQEKRLEGMTSEQILRGLLVKGIENIPKALFFLMPVFALFLKILYVRRDPLYIDHLIFAFHYHAFLFVFCSILIWANLATDISLGGFMAVAIIIVSPVYLYLSLKRVYSQGWFKTFIKFNLLLGFYFASLFFCLTAVVVISIFLI